jgi:HD superfamily phosphohydrolase
MIIKDCIYRFISVPDICEKFINTFLFQRLRQIKQLGLAYYVYPSAVHTRFEHSLGVMHLAGRVVDTLRKYSPITDREKHLVQIAGLLHDVGHVSFSHLMDDILFEKKHSMSKHEHRSVSILNSINNEYKIISPEEEKKVAKMILGNTFGEEKKAFLYQIVCNQSFGIDVDKLDYLQRDSYHTGMPSFQPDYLIQCLCVKGGMLAIKRKGLSEVELMYEARRRLLLLVCRHRVVLLIENIIRSIIGRLQLVNKFDDDEWLLLTDSSVQWMMDSGCPDLMLKIYTRDWRGIEEGDQFEHITTVTRDDIDLAISKIRWS